MTDSNSLQRLLEADIRKLKKAADNAPARSLFLRLWAHKYRKQILISALLSVGVVGYGGLLVELFASLEEAPVPALITAAYILGACVFIGFTEAD